MPKICTWKRHFALFATSEYIVRVTRKAPSFCYINIGPRQAIRDLGAPARKSFLSLIRAIDNSLSSSITAT